MAHPSFTQGRPARMAGNSRRSSQDEFRTFDAPTACVVGIARFRRIGCRHGCFNRSFTPLSVPIAGMFRHGFSHVPLHLQHGLFGHPSSFQVFLGSAVFFAEEVEGAFHDVWWCLYESFDVDSQRTFFFVGLESLQSHGPRFRSVAFGVVGDDVCFGHFASAEEEHGQESRAIFSSGAEEEQSPFSSQCAFHDPEGVSEFACVCFEQHFVEQGQSTTVDACGEVFFLSFLVLGDPHPCGVDHVHAIHAS